MTNSWRSFQVVVFALLLANAQNVVNRALLLRPLITVKTPLAFVGSVVTNGLNNRYFVKHYECKCISCGNKWGNK